MRLTDEQLYFEPFPLTNESIDTLVEEIRALKSDLAAAKARIEKLEVDNGSSASDRVH